MNQVTALMAMLLAAVKVTRANPPLTDIEATVIAVSKQRDTGFQTTLLMATLENVFEGDLNLADTPWTETAANPNPDFKGDVNDANSYQNQTATSHFYGGDLEL